MILTSERGATRAVYVLLVVVLAALVAPNASAVLNDAYAYLSMDTSSWVDDSGNGHTGTATGVTWTNAVYKLVASGSYDGAGDHIVLGSSDVAAQDVSVSAWVRFNSVAKDQFIISKGIGGGSTQNDWFLSMCGSGSYICLGRYDSSGTAHQYLWLHSGAIATGTWYHIAGTMDYDSNQIILYVNGVAKGNNTDSFTELNTAGDVWTGERYDGFGDMDGYIDEVAVYSRTLTPAEIVSLYNSGTGYNPYSSPPAAPTGEIDIRLYDEYDKLAMTEGASVKITNATDTVVRTNSSGYIFLFKNVSTSAYNFTVYNMDNYWNITTPFHIYNGTVYYINVTGAHVSFNVTNVLGEYLNNLTLRSGASTNSSGEIGDLNKRLLLKPNTTNYINVTKTGYLNQTFTINTTGRDLSYKTLDDLYQTDLYINVSVGGTATYVKNWTAVINGTATGGSWGQLLNITNYLATIKAMWGNYTINVTPEGYSINTINFSVGDNNVTKWVSVPVYAINSFYLNLIDEVAYNNITQEMIIELISDAFSGTYATSNGSIALEILTPADYTLRYYSSDGVVYPQRDYYQVLAPSNFYNLNLFSINESDEYPLRVTVVDTVNGDPVEGALVQLRRYFVQTNTYEVVEMAYTSYSGEALFRAQAYDGHYKLAVSYGGRTLLTNTPENFIPTSAGVIERIITFNTGTDYYESYQALPDIARSLTYNNNTGTLSFMWNDPSGIVTEGCLYADYPNGTQWSRLSSCQASTAGNVLLVLPDPLGTTYRYQAIISTSTNYSEYNLFNGLIDSAGVAGISGTVGAFLGVLIIGSLGIGGAFIGAAVSVMAAIMGVLFTSIVGLLPFSYGTIAGLVALAAGMGIYLMRR